MVIRETCICSFLLIHFCRCLRVSRTTPPHFGGTLRHWRRSTGRVGGVRLMHWRGAGV
jgi:hypothetical protein